MATKTGQKTVNPASRQRNKLNPYAKWTDPRTGWKYVLCKSWQANNDKPLARWFMWVEGYEKEYGDEYVGEMIGGLRRATDVEIDTSVWASKAAFLDWAQGEAVVK